MNRERYTLLIEDNDDRARVMENTLGDTKPENPVLRARTVCEALKIIQNSGIQTIDTLVLNPTVWLLSPRERWGTLAPLYLEALKRNHGKIASWPLFFSILNALSPNIRTEPGLMGKSNILLTSRSPKANSETAEVTQALLQFRTQTRQALVGKNTAWDGEVIEAFIKQAHFN